MFHPPPLFVEIGPGTLRAMHGDASRAWPLERAPDGKLTAGCREKLIAGLREFAPRKVWQPRARAICGLSVQGVSLRKIALPPAVNGDLENLLRLQIEKEFPLSPDELAWGWHEVPRAPDRREVLVLAVRKEVIGDYAEVLSAAGWEPVFTLSALARELFCPAPGEPHAILEAGDRQFEWVAFADGLAVQARIFPVAGDLPEVAWKNANVRVVYLSGGIPAGGLAEKLSARAVCRRLEVPGVAGVSPAIAGLKKSVAENQALPWLQAKPKPAGNTFNLSRPEHRRWLVRAGGLLVLLLLLPYAEALLCKPLLARKLAALQDERQRFVSVVDPELRFLQGLKQAQPPYLDALYLFSQAAPPGLHFDSLTMNQRGAITMKATLESAQQVTDFREKLIASGFFADISVEEQSPAPFQRKVSVRMTAQWKPAGARAVVKVTPAPNATSPSTPPSGLPGQMPAM